MKTAKSIPQIIRDNLFTLFHLLNFAIAAALAAVGSWKNILFLLVILLNAAIGIVQEIAARRRMEQLTLQTQPKATVLRRGIATEITPKEVKAGDLLIFESGMTVCTDCVVTEGQPAVNESVFTGEDEPSLKHPGDSLLSGSGIVAGHCIARAVCGVEKCFAAKTENEVKRTKGSSSELMKSMKKVTMVTGFLIVPLGVLMFWEALFLRGEPIPDAVVTASAGLLGMLPKGLVLLISIGLAVGVIRLSKKNVLVREMHSLENLAHCDVVCLDKTGTLTEGSLTVEDVILQTDDAELRRLMATYLTYTDDNNATYRALGEYFGRENPYQADKITPFASERKWSSVTLSDGRTLVLGAPEKLCRSVHQSVQELIGQGKRVLLAGLCRGEVNADSVQCIAYIVIRDKLRQNAAQTVRYFSEQGVSIKVISGDSAKAASAVARQAGIPCADRFSDTSEMTDAQLEDAAERNTVFGRVTPKQKKQLIAALQKQGHRVAMVGDGVNDLLAMRQADCSAAPGTACDAARQTAQLVLLDSDFAALRDVISEGRRVINNLTKSAGVFFIKTVYSFLLCVLCLCMNTDFPFIPIQITLIDAAIEAFPAFFMSFEYNDRKIEGTFLGSALRCAVPNAVAIFLCCVGVLVAAPHLGLQTAQTDLVLYLIVGTVSLAGVVRAGLPLNTLHGFLCSASGLGFFGSVILFAPLLQLPHPEPKSAVLFPVAALLGIGISVLLSIALQKRQPRSEKRNADAQPFAQTPLQP